MATQIPSFWRNPWKRLQMEYRAWRLKRKIRQNLKTNPIDLDNLGL